MGKTTTINEARMDGVHIQVIAGVNKGKTTIARLIEEMLRKEGFEDVTVFDVREDSVPGKAPIQMRVDATRKRPVAIEVIQLGKRTSLELSDSVSAAASEK